MTDPNFSWPSYMDHRATAPAAATNGLFWHISFYKGILAERLILPGHIVRVKETKEAAEVELVCSDQAFARLAESRLREWISLRDVEACPNAAEIVERLAKQEEEEMSSDNDSVRSDRPKRSSRSKPSPVLCHPTEHYFALCLQTPEALVKIGQFLEIQCIDAPDRTEIAEITAIRGGLLTVRCGNSRTENVFLTNERCHRIGWTESQVQKCSMMETTDELLTAARANPAPNEVFESYTVRENRFEVGMRVEAMDPVREGVFSPGTVVRIINRHYFIVNVDGSNEELICHRGSSSIFPMYWCQRNGLRLSPPQGFVCENEQEFSWAAYKAAKENGTNTNNGVNRPSAGDHFFDIPRANRKMERRRQLEVLIGEQMYPGTIIRTFRHLIWIHLDHHVEAKPPMVISVRSNTLFPCGFAQTFGIPLISPQSPKNHIERLDLKDLYSSSPGPIFLPSQRHYMPKYWLRETIWAPGVYIHPGCFCGPFISSERLSDLPTVIGPGPLPLVLHSLLASLICCAHRPKDFAEMIAAGKESSLPYIQVKARLKFRRFRVRVETCDRADRLPWWLIAFLTQIDACPGLVSLNPPDHACQWNCAANLSALPQMQSTLHTNTANYFNPTIKLVPKRFRRVAPDGNSLLSPIIAAARRRRERAPIVVGRRPVTRGIRFPKYQLKSSSRSGVVVQASPPFHHRASLRKAAMEEERTSRVPIAKVQPEIPMYSIPPVLSNPVKWTCQQLMIWLADTDAEPIRDRLQAEEVDGEAFLLMTLQDCLDYLGLKLGPALKVAAVIQELKLVFLTRFDPAPVMRVR